MKDHQLRAFVQIAESGSIRGAARTLALSQSALTKALRELETDVGAELLVRSWRGITFTDSGQVLLKRAQLALRSLEKARDEIRYLQRSNKAHLFVATSPLVALDVLPCVLKRFESLEPAAEIELTEGLLTTVIPDLLQGRLDFAIVVADRDELPREINFEALQLTPAFPAGRIGNPFRGARAWSDLKGASWVLNLSAGSQGQMFLSWLEDHGGTPGKITRSASPHLMAELMRRTDCLGFCPKILLDDRYYGAGLRAIEVSPAPASMTLGMLSRRGGLLTGPSAQLAALFRDALKRPA